MKVLKQQPERYLSLGDFLKLKSLSPKKSFLSYSITAHAFLGELEVAEALYIQGENKLDTYHKSFARFSLIVGTTRRSDYAKALAYLKEQKQDLHKTNKRFFIYQSYAFMHFFFGHFKKAKAYAKRALQQAIQHDFVFGKIISYDLLGHSNIHLGEIEEGRRFLQTAIAVARNVGESSLIGSIETSLLKFECQYSKDTKNSLRKLDEKLISLNTQDTYSRSELLLEKAQIHILRGNVNEAKVFLEEAGQYIFRYRHRRHIALLNFKLAYVSYLQNDKIRALSLLEAALSNLNLNADMVLRLKIKGLQYQISKDQNIFEEVLALSRRLDLPLSKRILSRQTKQMDEPLSNVDRLGDLISQTQHHDSFDEILSLGNLGLLSMLLPKPGKYLIVDIAPGIWILWDHGQVIALDLKKTKILRDVILLLSRGMVTKEELINEVWQYQYDPLRHDPLIYQTMKKLRSILGKHLVTSIDGAYSIDSVEDVIHLKSSRKKEIQKTQSYQFTIKNDLNYRQNMLLSELRDEMFISPQEYALRFKVSRITASRDLNHLLQQEYLHTVGKGRSIRYYKV